MDNLSISQRRTGGVVILDLAGKITMGGTNRQLRETVVALVADGDKNVVLNLAAVTSVDSSGLGEIIAAYSSLRRSSGDLKLLNVSDRVLDLMTITKLYTVFEIHTTEAEAVGSFGNHDKDLPALAVAGSGEAATHTIG